jgi:hypothetical protein
MATIAEQWLEKIDHPVVATSSGISRDEIERMQEDAVDVVQSLATTSMFSRMALVCTKSGKMIGILPTRKPSKPCKAKTRRRKGPSGRS